MYSVNSNPVAMNGDIGTICKRYMNYHVIAHKSDGSMFEGIIDGMDANGVTMLIPEDVGGDGMEAGLTRQPFGYGRFRRFHRRFFPFPFFGFPFFRPFPYFSPYYAGFPGYGFPGYGFGGVF